MHARMHARMHVHTQRVVGEGAGGNREVCHGYFPTGFVMCALENFLQADRDLLGRSHCLHSPPNTAARIATLLQRLNVVLRLQEDFPHRVCRLVSPRYSQASIMSR